MCWVMWSSTCSSNGYRSWDAFILVLSTQSVTSWHRPGRILERFLDTSSRQPSPGRATARENRNKRETEISKENPAHINPYTGLKLRDKSYGRPLQRGTKYSKCCWATDLCKLHFFNTYCTIWTPHSSLKIYITGWRLKSCVLRWIQKGKRKRTEYGTFSMQENTA